MACTLNGGEQVNELTMPRGASVAGKLMCRGSGVTEVTMNLTPLDRKDYAKELGGCTTVTSSENGSFLFTNVPADRAYILSARIRGLAQLGALKSTECTVQGDESVLELGDVTAEKGNSLTGLLVCSDGNPLPAGTKVRLSRQVPTEALDATVDKEGRFEFKGLPPEAYDLSVICKGYCLSPENESIEPRNKRALLGLIDNDIDLRVKLDPGEQPQQVGAYDGAILERPSKTPLKGIDAP